MMFKIKHKLREGYDDDGSGALGIAMEKAFVKEWHAPGLGEVHNKDHSKMIFCAKDFNGEEIIDDELAKRICAALNREEDENKS